jgi:S1-C subfamily serine protease
MEKRTALILRMLSSIVMVEDVSLVDSSPRVGENIVGTAFAFDYRGYLVTAKHVVQGIQPESLRLRFTFSGPPNSEYAMSVLKVQAVYEHPVLDVAVVVTERAFAPERVQPRSQMNVSVGEGMLLVGYACGTGLTFCDDILGAGSSKSFSPVSFQGMISGLVPHDGRPVDLLLYDCTTFGGNSGAPVISTDSSLVVGMHLRGFENHIGYCLPIRCFESFGKTVIETHEPRRGNYQRRRSGRA